MANPNLRHGSGVTTPNRPHGQTCFTLISNYFVTNNCCKQLGINEVGKVKNHTYATVTNMWQP